MSLVLFMQVIGAAAAARVIDRLPLFATLSVGGALLAGSAAVVFVLPKGEPFGFEAACAAFGFLWLFLAPFFVAFALRVDGGGAVALLVPAAQLLGSAAGPLAASLTVGEQNAGVALNVSLAFEGSALLLLLAFAAAARGRVRTEGRQPEAA